MANAVANADNWREYFDSIREVCPWSSAHYAKHRIDIVKFMGIPYPLKDYSARIYICDSVTSSQLTKWSDHLNDLYPQEEWFWSHPSEGGNSTSEPVLIQQDYKYLEKIRKQLHKSTDYLGVA